MDLLIGSLVPDILRSPMRDKSMHDWSQGDGGMSEGLPTVAGLRNSVATMQTVAVRQVMADGIIAVAAKAKDWPLLHEAVDIKIEDQREFVAVWDSKVKEGRPSTDGETLTRPVRVSVLIEQSGIPEKQVSRWRTSLLDAAAYHDKLVLAACRKAGLEVEESHRVNTGEYEWYTPERYILAAREVTGGIDLTRPRIPWRKRGCRLHSGSGQRMMSWAA
jgi:hypothetical protein